MKSDQVASFDRASYRNRGGIIQKLVTRYKAALYTTRCGAATVIKSNAEFWITDGGELYLGDNCVIQNYAFFQLTKPRPRVLIGDNTVIGRHCMIKAKNSIVIGSNVLMAAHVHITDHNHGIAAGRLIRDQRAEIGSVTIGDDVWIGAGAKILMNAKLGVGAVVGANAVVTGDIPANAIVVGVPARIIGYRS